MADASEHEGLERKLRDTEAGYRALVERLPLVTYVDTFSGAGVTISISEQVEGMLGYSPDEWIGDPDLWSKVLHPEDRERVLEEDASNREGPFAMEYRMIARDGRVVWCRDEAFVVLDDAGNPVCWQGVMIDITELRKLVHRRDAIRPILTRGVLFSIATVQGLSGALSAGWEELDDASRREIAWRIECETARLRDLADRSLSAFGLAAPGEAED